MTFAPIQSGREYSLPGNENPAGAVRLICGDVQQRNWSRVAKGTLVSPDGQTVDCFVKQYVGKDGLVHPDHWTYEQAGVGYAAAILDNIAQVPKLLGHSKDLLLNIFEYHEIVSIDRLLRTDVAAFDRCIDSILHRMAQTLEALLDAAVKKDVSQLKTKNREYGRLGLAVNFKGFEIRNVGVPCDVEANVSQTQLVLFDFVRPYLAPVEEAAAKLMVSVGMLNWGTPVTRFILGPDTELLKRAAAILHPWLDREAILAELDLQEKFRNAELKGEHSSEVFLKWLGVAIVGRYYFAKLRRWCATNI